jgi:hypothetical protein
VSGGSYIVSVAFENPPSRQEEAHNTGQDGKRNPKHSKTVIAAVTLQQAYRDEKQHATKYRKYHAAKNRKKRLLLIHPTVTNRAIVKTNTGNFVLQSNSTTVG